MDKFTAADAINGKSFELWVNGLKKAEVLTAQADSEIQTEKLPIAGKLSDEDMEVGSTGTGTMTFYSVIDDSLIADINNAFKENKRFTCDLRGVIENKTTGRTRTIIITDCKINKFSPLAVDITKVLNDTFTFSYSPENCDII